MANALEVINEIDFFVRDTRISRGHALKSLKIVLYWTVHGTVLVIEFANNLNFMKKK